MKLLVITAFLSMTMLYAYSLSTMECSSPHSPGDTAVCTFVIDDKETGNQSICVVQNSTNGEELCCIDLQYPSSNCMDVGVDWYISGDSTLYVLLLKGANDPLILSIRTALLEPLRFGSSDATIHIQDRDDSIPDSSTVSTSVTVTLMILCGCVASYICSEWPYLLLFFLIFHTLYTHVAWTSSNIMLIEAELVRSRFCNFVYRAECFHPVTNAKTNSRSLNS